MSCMESGSSPAPYKALQPQAGELRGCSRVRACSCCDERFAPSGIFPTVPGGALHNSLRIETPRATHTAVESTRSCERVVTFHFCFSERTDVLVNCDPRHRNS